MKYLTDDTRITGMEEVIAPNDLLSEIPITDRVSELVFSNRQAISRMLNGRDPRLLVIIGPCSIHDPAAALEYADRLSALAGTLNKELHVLMRVYFEKPRTTVGWKGLINDPNLNDSFDINHGLRIARGLLRDIAERGLGTGTEYLDPITPQYLGDLVSWGAIGARTTESQNSPSARLGAFLPHRLQEQHRRLHPGGRGRDQERGQSAHLSLCDQGRPFRHLLDVRE